MPSLCFPMSPEGMWFRGKSHYMSYLKLLGYRTYNAIFFGHIALVILDPSHQMEDLVISVCIYFLYSTFQKIFQLLDNLLRSLASVINRILREMEIKIYIHIF